MITETVKLVPTKVGHFYVWLAMAIALFAFTAFVPTYWLQLPAGTFVGTPLVHVHTVIFSAWTLFLITQSYLAANGRLKNHRAWGMAGIGLATSLVFFGTAVAIGSLRYRLTLPASGTARASFIVAMTNMVLFSGFFIAAMVNVKRSEIHRRLIFLATISLLPAAMSRITYLLAKGSGPGLRPALGPAPPVISQLVPHLLAVGAFILAGMLYDWKTRGRPHSAWIIGGIIISVALLLRAPLGDTALWQRIADASLHMSG